MPRHIDAFLKQSITVLWCAVLLFAIESAAAVPPAPPVYPPLNFFGIGADYHTGQNLTNWIPQMSGIGIHMIRTCEPGQMDYLAEKQIQFGGLLFGLPPGDTLDAPGSLPVKDLQRWKAWVTQRVKAAHGRVKYWEVWNEPPNFTGAKQTPSDYAKILVTAYDAARAVDPTCLIGLAAKSVHVNYLEQVINAGARDHFDFIVLHPYEVLGSVGDNLGTESVYLHIVPTVRKMLAAQDPSRVNVPIIFTEIGSDAGKGANNQGEALVKAYTLGLAGGVASIQWFEGIDGDSGPMGLLQADGTPRPAYTAMAQMIKHLGQQPEYLGWLMFADKDYAFVFQNGDAKVLITWARRGSPDEINFNTVVDITDPLTGKSASARSYSLTTSPILVGNVPANSIRQAIANKPKPFPWDGDYTDAKSVSITTGKINNEQGLHTLAGDRVAADVIAYGGPARAGSVPGGNAFVVDPNFLSYTHTPIEISVVVRRNEANDNAGFKLNYESINGFKNLGWYTVPDNKQWHTMTWKIKDDEFVNYWGFNFSLDSDGKTYNKYFIQSVTVRKIAN